jgi:hypothetical protein
LFQIRKLCYQTLILNFEQYRFKVKNLFGKKTILEVRSI